MWFQLYHFIFPEWKKNTFYSREIHVKLHLRFQFSHEKLSMKDYFQLLLTLGLAMYVYPNINSNLSLIYPNCSQIKLGYHLDKITIKIVKNLDNIESSLKFQIQFRS